MAREYSLGVIGVGNMGSALVRGIVEAGAVPAEKVIVADADAARASKLSGEVGVKQAASNSDVAADSEYVILAVKPKTVPQVLKEIAPVLHEDQTVVSIAAGVTLARIAEHLGECGPAIVRVMPNTPALVGAGVSAVAAPGVPADRVAVLNNLLRAVGEVVDVQEELMDAVTGLSGSGPAFVFVFIEALADGGVAVGLPRPLAQQLAVQTVSGAVRLVQETGQQPGALKDAVASPGGTTEAGLSQLADGGFQGLVERAVRAAAARSRELSQGE